MPLCRTGGEGAVGVAVGAAALRPYLCMRVV